MTCLLVIAEWVRVTIGSFVKILLCLSLVFELCYSHFGKKRTGVVFVGSDLMTQFMFVLPAFLWGYEVWFADHWRFTTEQVEEVLPREGNSCCSFPLRLIRGWRLRCHDCWLQIPCDGGRHGSARDGGS